MATGNLTGDVTGDVTGDLNAIDVNGGAIDNAVIGANTAGLQVHLQLLIQQET